MSRFTFLRAVLLASLMALAIVPAGALGAQPEIFHERVVESFENEDLCGFTVDVEVMGVFTDRIVFDKEGNFVRFSSTSSFRTTFTEEDGDAVIIQNANLFQDVQPIVDEEAGTLTFILTYKGLPEKIQTAQGPVLLRDAGFIVFAETVDLETGEFLGTEVLINRGPHPDADSDFALFCEVVTEALA
jgi:hypothetical protein